MPVKVNGPTVNLKRETLQKGSDPIIRLNKNIYVIPESVKSVFLKASQNFSEQDLKNTSGPLLRSSRSQMFFKIGVLKNFANITGRHLCWSPFLMFPVVASDCFCVAPFVEQLLS